MTLLEKSLIVIFSLLLIATVINGLLVWLRPGLVGEIDAAIQ